VSLKYLPLASFLLPQHNLVDNWNKDPTQSGSFLQSLVQSSSVATGIEYKSLPGKSTPVIVIHIGTGVVVAIVLVGGMVDAAVGDRVVDIAVDNEVIGVVDNAVGDGVVNIAVEDEVIGVVDNAVGDGVVDIVAGVVDEVRGRVVVVVDDEVVDGLKTVTNHI
jgi:hypothetical protein